VDYTLLQRDLESFVNRVGETGSRLSRTNASFSGNLFRRESGRGIVDENKRKASTSFKLKK